MPDSPVAVSTIVSTDMADAVARKYNVELRRTLTGFKFIGEQIGLLEKKGECERYILGFEESYGYLSGPHVRDKDGVNAAMLVCQMARFSKACGQNLLQRMQILYDEFGWFQDVLYSYNFKGQTGFLRMQDIMSTLRTSPPAYLAQREVESVVDYSVGVKELPPADVMEFHLKEGGKVLVRPSGTEPKMKVYLFARGQDRAEAQRMLNALRRDIEKYLS